MANIRFQVLYDLILHHPHYIDERCRALTIRPTDSSLQLIHDHNMIFKSKKGGGVIIGELMKDESGTWILKNAIAKTEPLKLTFLIEKDNDYSNFEKGTFLDDFVRDENEFGLKGQRIYYFDNLDNSTGEIRKSNLPVQLVHNNISVTKEDRVWKVNETLHLIPSFSGQSIIKFKKVIGNPNSDRQIAQISLVQNSAIAISLNKIYRDLMNREILDEKDWVYPTLAPGLYTLDSGPSAHTRVFFDETLNLSKTWGIFELFENENSTFSKIEYRINFEEKNSLDHFNAVDKGINVLTGNDDYKKNEFITFFKNNAETPYRESIKYPDF